MVVIYDRHPVPDLAAIPDRHLLHAGDAHIMVAENILAYGQLPAFHQDGHPAPGDPSIPDGQTAFC